MKRRACGQAITMAAVLIRGCRVKHSWPLLHRTFPRYFVLGQSTNARDGMVVSSCDAGRAGPLNGHIFDSKKTKDIVRAIFVLKLCSYDIFVRNSLQLMSFAPKILGKRISTSLMKGTMYSQFVAGETMPAIKNTISDLKNNGIGTMLYFPTEEDVSSDITELREETFDRNCELFFDCIENAEPGGYVQVKVTALCSPMLMKVLDTHLEAYQTTAEKPQDLSVERFAQGLDNCKQEATLIPVINAAQNEHLINSLRRMNALTEKAISKNVRVVIDAEYTYTQATMQQMILALQYKFNKTKAWVYNTYQCYRKDTFDRLLADLKTMDKLGFYFGAKIVRGAYMTMERQRAKEMGYDDPIHDSYEDTNRMYNRVVATILDRVAHSPAEVMVASHNEESVEKAIQKMNELGITKQNSQVAFGQIYGMCDHLSLLLGKEGYNIYKSVPYGPVDATMPYLARRANENRDVMARTEKERFIYRQQLRKRLMGNASSNSPQLG